MQVESSKGSLTLFLKGRVALCVNMLHSESKDFLVMRLPVTFGSKLNIKKAKINSQIAGTNRENEVQSRYSECQLNTKT